MNSKPKTMIGYTGGRGRGRGREPAKPPNNARLGVDPGLGQSTISFESNTGLTIISSTKPPMTIPLVFPTLTPPTKNMLNAPLLKSVNNEKKL